MAFSTHIATSTTARGIAARAFRAKTANSNVPGKGKGRVVSNERDDVNATQFQVRLGKNTTVPITLGFTKSNELFVGRMAMLGVAFAAIGEVITGRGPLGQLSIETGSSITDVDGAVLFLIAFNLIAALLPAKGKLILSEEEFETRPKGSLQDPKVSILQPKKFFGISGFGFTKENELFVGRMAQLGFAAMLLGESLLPGDLGPLGQIGFTTGVPLNETEPLLLFSIVFTLFAAINEGRGDFVDE